MYILPGAFSFNVMVHGFMVGAGVYWSPLGVFYHVGPLQMSLCSSGLSDAIMNIIVMNQVPFIVRCKYCKYFCGG